MSRWPVTGPSGYWLLASSSASKVKTAEELGLVRNTMEFYTQIPHFYVLRVPPSLQPTVHDTIKSHPHSPQSPCRSQWPRGLRRYGRSPAGIVGSNPNGCMDVCLSWVLCVVVRWVLCVVRWVLCVVRYKSLRRAGHSFRGVLLTVVRRCVWSRNSWMTSHTQSIWFSLNRRWCITGCIS